MISLKSAIHTLPWRKIFLFLLILCIFLAISSCQVGKVAENAAQSFTSLPDRIGQAFVGIVGGLKNIGEALSDQVANIVKGMTGR